MAVVDRRFDLLRQQRVDPLRGAAGRTGVVSLKDLLTQGLQPYPVRSAPEAEQENLGGWKGVLAKATNFVPVKYGLMKPLEILDTPRRAIIATLDEVAEGLDRKPGTTFSFSDVWDKTKDPTYGFGTAMGGSTGNKWVDRTIGFLGDVALDPLTYVTFGTEAAAREGLMAAGREGRMELARQVYKKVLQRAAPKAEGEGFVMLDEAARAAARREAGYAAKRTVEEGLSGARKVLTGAEAAELGIPRAGIYMFGKRISKGAPLKVPLTGKVGAFGDAALARLRLAAAGTGPGAWLVEKTTPKWMRAERLAMARGEVAPEQMWEKLSQFAAEDAFRASAGAAARQAGDAFTAMLKDSPLADNPQLRATVHRVLEATDKSVFTQAEQDAAAAVKALYDSWYDQLDKALKDLDPTAEFGKVKRYHPHVLSDDAAKWMQGGGPQADLVREMFVKNAQSPTGFFNPRALEENADWFGHRLRADELNIESLNRIAREEGGLAFDFFETDIVKTTQKYIDMYSSQMGKIGRASKAFEDGLLFTTGKKWVEDGEAVRQASRDLRKAVAEYDDMFVRHANVSRGAAKGLDDFFKGIDKELAAAGGDRLALATKRQARVAKWATKLHAQRQAVDAAIRELDEATNPALMQLLEANGSAIAVSMGQQRELLRDALGELRGAIDKVVVQEAGASVEVSRNVLAGATELRAEAVAAAKAAADRATELQTELRDALEFSSWFGDNIEKVLNGGGFKYPKGLSDERRAAYERVVKDVRDFGAASTDEAKKRLKKTVGTAGYGGKLRDFLLYEIKREGSTLRELLGSDLGKIGDLGKMTIVKHEAMLDRVMANGADSLEAGVAGAVLLARAEKFFGSPDAWEALGVAQAEHAAVKEHVRRLLGAERFDKMVAKATNTSSDFWEGRLRKWAQLGPQIEEDYGRLIQLYKQLDEYHGEIQKVTDFFNNGGADEFGWMGALRAGNERKAQATLEEIYRLENRQYAFSPVGKDLRWDPAKLADAEGAAEGVRAGLTVDELADIEVISLKDLHTSDVLSLENSATWNENAIIEHLLDGEDMPFVGGSAAAEAKQAEILAGGRTVERTGGPQFAGAPQEVFDRAGAYSRFTHKEGVGSLGNKADAAAQMRAQAERLQASLEKRIVEASKRRAGRLEGMGIAELGPDGVVRSAVGTGESIREAAYDIGDLPLYQRVEEEVAKSSAQADIRLAREARDEAQSGVAIGGRTRSRVSGSGHLDEGSTAGFKPRLGASKSRGDIKREALEAIERYRTTMEVAQRWELISRSFEKMGLQPPPKLLDDVIDKVNAERAAFWAEKTVSRERLNEIVDAARQSEEWGAVTAGLSGETTPSDFAKAYSKYVQILSRAVGDQGLTSMLPTFDNVAHEVMDAFSANKAALAEAHAALKNGVEGAQEQLNLLGQQRKQIVERARRWYVDTNPAAKTKGRVSERFAMVKLQERVGQTAAIRNYNDLFGQILEMERQVKRGGDWTRRMASRTAMAPQSDLAQIAKLKALDLQISRQEALLQDLTHKVLGLPGRMSKAAEDARAAWEAVRPEAEAWVDRVAAAKQSPDYVLALRRESISNFLSKIANVDGWKLSDEDWARIGLGVRARYSPQQVADLSKVLKAQEREGGLFVNVGGTFKQIFDPEDIPPGKPLYGLPRQPVGKAYANDGQMARIMDMYGINRAAVGMDPDGPVVRPWLIQDELQRKGVTVKWRSADGGHVARDAEGGADQLTALDGATIAWEIGRVHQPIDITSPKPAGYPVTRTFSREEWESLFIPPKKVDRLHGAYKLELEDHRYRLADLVTERNKLRERLGSPSKIRRADPEAGAYIDMLDSEIKSIQNRIAELEPKVKSFDPQVREAAWAKLNDMWAASEDLAQRRMSQTEKLADPIEDSIRRWNGFPSSHTHATIDDTAVAARRAGAREAYEASEAAKVIRRVDGMQAQLDELFNGKAPSAWTVQQALDAAHAEAARIMQEGGWYRGEGQVLDDFSKETFFRGGREVRDPSGLQYTHDFVGGKELLADESAKLQQLTADRGVLAPQVEAAQQAARVSPLADEMLPIHADLAAAESTFAAARAEDAQAAELWAHGMWQKATRVNQRLTDPVMDAFEARTEELGNFYAERLDALSKGWDTLNRRQAAATAKVGKEQATLSGLVTKYRAAMAISPAENAARMREAQAAAKIAQAEHIAANFGDRLADSAAGKTLTKMEAAKLRDAVAVGEEAARDLDNGYRIVKAAKGKTRRAPLTAQQTVKLGEKVRLGEEAAAKLSALRLSDAEAVQLIRDLGQMDVLASLPNDAAGNALRATLQTAFDSQVDLGLARWNMAQAETALFDAQNMGKWADDVKDGFESLESWGLPGMNASKEVKEMFDNFSRVAEPEIARDLQKFLGWYTKRFKAYATASPGFHIRNAMSNTFMVFAAGGDPRNMWRGTKLYEGWLSARRSGQEALWVQSLPEGERTLFNKALAAFDAVGGGQQLEALPKAFTASKGVVGRIDNNWWLRANRNLAERVEGSARFMLAYDSVAKGMELSGAAARVRRFLFDYSMEGRTVLDDTMRNIVPFWTWMSRNLPLQIVNRWSNPKAYAIFNSFMRNFTTPLPDGAPDYLKEQGAGQIAPGWALAPDVGFNRLNETFSQLQDPIRLASDVNPLLRVPVEVLGGRRLYNNTPFGRQPEEVVGGPAQPLVQALLGMLGQTSEVSQPGQGLPIGTTVTSPKANYAVMNMLPPVAQLERLLSSTQKYKDREDSSRASWLGIPVRQFSSNG